MAVKYFIMKVIIMSAFTQSLEHLALAAAASLIIQPLHENSEPHEVILVELLELVTHLWVFERV